MAGRERDVDVGSVPPLLWAIAQFRDDLERLIADQKAQLLSFERLPEVDPVPPRPAPAAPAPPPMPEPAPVPERPSFSSSVPAAGGEVWSPSGDSRLRRAAAQPAAVTRPQAPLPRESVPPEPSPSASTGEHPVVSAELVEGSARPEDARQRLDALARLLDRRIKQSGGAGGPELTS